MKTLLILTALLSTPAFAHDFGHWAGRVSEGMEGNYDCFPTKCVDADPALGTVNCTNLDNVDFSFSRFTNGKAPGYLSFEYLPDSLTTERDYVVDGEFSIEGFSVGETAIRDSMMGSNGRVAVKSVNIQMSGTNGDKATMTIDFGGKAPLKAELNCCTPGDECSNTPDQVGPPIFQNPPVLCPSFPKEARDECLGRNR